MKVNTKRLFEKKIKSVWEITMKRIIKTFKTNTVINQSGIFILSVHILNLLLGLRN